MPNAKGLLGSGCRLCRSAGQGGLIGLGFGLVTVGLFLGPVRVSELAAQPNGSGDSASRSQVSGTSEPERNSPQKALRGEVPRRLPADPIAENLGRAKRLHPNSLATRAALATQRLSQRSGPVLRPAKPVVEPTPLPFGEIANSRTARQVGWTVQPGDVWPVVVPKSPVAYVLPNSTELVEFSPPSRVCAQGGPQSNHAHRPCRSSSRSMSWVPCEEPLVSSRRQSQPMLAEDPCPVVPVPRTSGLTESHPAQKHPAQKHPAQKHPAQKHPVQRPPMGDAVEQVSQLLARIKRVVEHNGARSQGLHPGKTEDESYSLNSTPEEFAEEIEQLARCSGPCTTPRLTCGELPPTYSAPQPITLRDRAANPASGLPSSDRVRLLEDEVAALQHQLRIAATQIAALRNRGCQTAGQDNSDKPKIGRTDHPQRDSFADAGDQNAPQQGQSIQRCRDGCRCHPKCECPKSSACGPCGPCSVGSCPEDGCPASSCGLAAFPAGLFPPGSWVEWSGIHGPQSPCHCTATQAAYPIHPGYAGGGYGALPLPLQPSTLPPPTPHDHGPLVASHPMARLAKPRFAAPSEAAAGSGASVAALRQTASAIDRLADRLEEMSLYSQADQLRTTAHTLRVEGRRLGSSSPRAQPITHSPQATNRPDTIPEPQGGCFGRGQGTPGGSVWTRASERPSPGLRAASQVKLPRSWGGAGSDHRWQPDCRIRPRAGKNSASCESTNRTSMHMTVCCQMDLHRLAETLGRSYQLAAEQICQPVVRVVEQLPSWSLNASEPPSRLELARGWLERNTSFFRAWKADNPALWPLRWLLLK